VILLDPKVDPSTADAEALIKEARRLRRRRSLIRSAIIPRRVHQRLEERLFHQPGLLVGSYRPARPI
jgi:hypothetical protein